MNHHISLTFYKVSQLLVVLLRLKYAGLLPHLIKRYVTCEQFHERTIIFPIKLQWPWKQKKNHAATHEQDFLRDTLASSFWWFEQHMQAVSTNSIIPQRSKTSLWICLKLGNSHQNYSKKRFVKDVFFDTKVKSIWIPRLTSNCKHFWKFLQSTLMPSHSSNINSEILKKPNCVHRQQMRTCVLKLIHSLFKCMSSKTF